MVAAVLLTVALAAAGVVAVLCAVFVDNWNIEYEEFSFGKGDTEIRIAHLSDLHFPRNPVDCERLLRELERRRIDLVALTGDLVCLKSDPAVSGAYAFAETLAARYPVYFVAGNHEKYCKTGGITEALRARGVHVLENETFYVIRGGKRLAIAGVLPREDYRPAEGARDFTLLLAHHPEKFAQYAKGKPDLVLAGHAHGGQFRFFGRGLYAPGQGLFPKYTSGLYREGNTSMVVSRGIGKSRFPFRFNDPPHVPIITIKF